ncbi:MULTISPECIES: GxxExxY protein [unclassified Sphingopyxis]|jgi:GxxExxY protein|uniref:GxxExxY protein n=1 Tax=unclassified Sphingopyxis TaxID=2614943 RepID=UPI0025E867E1|nr:MULTISPECIES: GxxExxY protein [unclassified Sphingopyxis]MBU0824242.1 GxxExxY protein [Alphaproteobacteria bacterium]MBU0864712.1 GxxExxY protein [Alphaproteobacteria bacterium]MBU1826671.1 GxxExxY protein [Alphaproteobacteria bacterium]
MTASVEDLARLVVDCGFRLHQNLGPGLLESAYEAILADQLARRGIVVERQKPIPIKYDGIELAEGFRADLLLNGQLLVELKSVERLSPLHSKQVLTYLRLLDLPLGVLINFGGATFKEGVRRIANGDLGR